MTLRDDNSRQFVAQGAKLLDQAIENSSDFSGDKTQSSDQLYLDAVKLSNELKGQKIFSFKSGSISESSAGQIKNLVDAIIDDEDNTVADEYVVDLNGHKITQSDATQLATSKNLTFTDGTIEFTDETKGAESSMINPEGDAALTLDNVTLTTKSGAAFKIVSLRFSISSSFSLPAFATVPSAVLVFTTL